MEPAPGPHGPPGSAENGTERVSPAQAGGREKGRGVEVPRLDRGRNQVRWAAGSL